MSNKLLSVTVHGKQHKWSFDFYADPKYMQDWLDDGLEVVQIYNVIPAWLPAPLVKPWCIAQNIFNFRWWK